MNQHRQRRPQQRARQHEEERMQQVLQRLKSALQLGLRSTSQDKMGMKKWCNTDAEVQVQAVRAILAFVSTLSSHPGRPAVLQVAVEDSVATLERLLGAERETIYSRAADASAGLVAAMSDGLLGFGGKRLVGPLAHLLKCSKLTTAISAATALHGILVRVKTLTSIKGSEDSLWKALEDADVLTNIVNTIQEERETNAKDAALTELLAVIVERWPEARYRIGCNSSFTTALLRKCLSSNEGVIQGALHATSALALCGCVAALLLKDSRNIWSTVSICLHPAKHSRTRMEALRLLTSLSKAHTFGASFTGPHMEAIAAGCLNALEQATHLGGMKWSPDVELLVVEAAHATSSVLSWPGSHHTSFLQNGVDKVVLAALSGLHSQKADALHEDQQSQLLSNSVGDRRSRGNKLHPRLRPLLWEIVGWLGAHHNLESENSALALNIEYGKPSSKLCVQACASLLKALCKRGQGPVWFEMKPIQDLGADLQGKLPEEHPVSTHEMVQISKAVLLLLSSPSQVLSSCTKVCLENALVLHGLDWLPSLVKTLALVVSNAVNIDHLQTTTNLLVLACVSWVQVCQDQLIHFKVLKVVLDIIRGQTEGVDQIKTERLSALSSSVHPMGAKPCCFDGESWEGNDSVLFTALWALPKLLQGSDLAKKMRGSITQEMLDSSNWCDLADGEVVDMLLKVAADVTKASGVRWWSVCSLACLGVYGFPSILGQDLKRLLDDPSLADVTFRLGNGSQQPAHGVVLALRCQVLLPADLRARVTSHLSDSSSHMKSKSPVVLEMERFSGTEHTPSLSLGRSPPSEVRVSPRVTFAVLRIVLEFVYAGIVYIPLNLVAEVKLVAKRCRLEPLTSLLRGKIPTWGQPVAPCDLASALSSSGHPLSDITLQAGKNKADSLTEEGCRESGLENLYAHRFVLSARSDYFQALFRSGMRDSAQEVLKVAANKSSIMKFLLYLYSEETKPEQPDCAWRNMGVKAQLEYLECLVNLADLAGGWLLGELQEQTWALAGIFLKENVNLCPSILTLAAAGQQWVLVEKCAACMAPEYVQLRDSGVLDGLDEHLADFVRAAHVKPFMMGKLEAGEI